MCLYGLEDEGKGQHQGHHCIPRVCLSNTCKYFEQAFIAPLSQRHKVLKMLMRQYDLEKEVRGKKKTSRRTSVSHVTYP